ncbi:MAG: ABC transporter permease, partial [bacterium]|nr:ABC transporter permease [bacterium]
MRKTLYVAAREYMETVRTKAFIIGILIAPLLMGGSILAMVLLKGHVDTSDKRVAVVDHSGVVAPALV